MRSATASRWRSAISSSSFFTRPDTRRSTSPSSRGKPASRHELFTGDTLFVGAVGRPDLLGEEQMRQLAGELYDSLFGKLLKLDDAVEVHPGHGAGSLCGTGISAEPHSTLGRERRFNPALQHGSREAFVAAVLADLPETPPYFKVMKRINQEGPALLGLAAGYAGATAIDVEAGGRRGEPGRVPDRPAWRRAISVPSIRPAR